MEIPAFEDNDTGGLLQFYWDSLKEARSIRFRYGVFIENMTADERTATLRQEALDEIAKYEALKNWLAEHRAYINTFIAPVPEL